MSEFGREVVARMNVLGMLVDVSHASRAAFDDALDASTAPLIASHSGCTAIRDHQRNLTDDQLRRLADAGGCVGIVFHGGFLDDAAAAEDADVGTFALIARSGVRDGGELYGGHGVWG